MGKDLPSATIKLERGSSGQHYALTLIAPEGSTAGVVIDTTPANRAALEYFFDKLKNGLSIWDVGTLINQSQNKKALISSDTEAVFRLASGTAIHASLDLGRLRVVAAHDGGRKPEINFEKIQRNAINITVELLPD
jgi:hypothetical protein